MRWPRDAQDWPLTEYSRLVLNRPHRWHVQEAGQGDVLLLIHGAGGATQSWRGLFPLLAKSHRVVAVDLPGQGFTGLGGRMRCGLEQVAEDILSLMEREGWHPSALIGHSAGAAIALRIAEMGTPRAHVIGVNAALQNFEGVAGWLFPIMARTLALNPFTADLFAASVTRKRVERLIEGTGSRIDEEGLRLYQRLASDRTHVDATLAMMSQWRLDGLLERLPRLQNPVTLIAGTNDRAVPPEASRRAAERLPHARLIEAPGLGHLMHEEAPELVARHVRDALG